MKKQPEVLAYCNTPLANTRTIHKQNNSYQSNITFCLFSCMLRLYKGKVKEPFFCLCSFTPRSGNKVLVISIKLCNLAENCQRLNRNGSAGNKVYRVFLFVPALQ